jgi:shikimate kinase
MRIILIGFMGSGKTTIAKALAHDLGFKFIDIDAEVEKSEQKTIANIFEVNGEDYFRKIETNELKKLIDKKFIVVASGGGTPCSESNIEFIKNNFTSVFLNVDSEQLLTRLKKKGNKRPLIIESKNIDNTVLALLQNRMIFYNQADIIIDIIDSNTKTVVNEIMSKL